MKRRGRLQLVTDDDARLSTPAPEPLRAWSTRHDVQFYESDDFLASSIAAFLVEGVRAGQPIVVIATDVHRNAISARMRAMGVDIDDLMQGRDCVWADARETLSGLMEGRVPNRELFDSTVGNVFEKLMQNRRYVVMRAYGEMVNLLWSEGNRDAALVLEQFWNDLATRFHFSLRCAYALNHFFREEADGKGFRQVCSLHTHIGVEGPPGGPAAIPP